MGFFDSLIKSTIRKTVNTAVDRAVDTAFDKISGQNTQPQPSAPVQPRVSTIARPNLTGKIYETDCFIDTDGTELTFAYELPENLYDYNSGAVDIPLAYCVAHSEDEYEDNCDELYGILPIIYFENGCSFDNALKSKKNLVCTKIGDIRLLRENMNTTILIPLTHTRLHINSIFLRQTSRKISPPYSCLPTAARLTKLSCHMLLRLSS